MRRSATPAQFPTDPWVETHGYYHRVAPRHRRQDGRRYSTDNFGMVPQEITRRIRSFAFALSNRPPLA